MVHNGDDRRDVQFHRGLHSERGAGEVNPANWGILKGLTPGDDIRIVLNDKKFYRAKFQSVSDEAIMVGLSKTVQVAKHFAGRLFATAPLRA